MDSSSSARKYVLVDPLMHRPSLAEKSLSELDKVIKSTLDSQLPDDEKAKLYVSALKRFRAYEDSTKPPPPKIDLEKELATALPPQQQYKAVKLLRLLKQNPDISWTNDGELIYRQKKVPKSHIADLFNDALAAKRPAQGAVGWEDFEDGLADVPETLVKKRKKVKKVISSAAKRYSQRTAEWEPSDDALSDSTATVSKKRNRKKVKWTQS